MKIEKQKKQKILFAAVAITIAGLFSGCVASKEFATVPQDGAIKTGIFPNFSQKPQAETEQFTLEERDQLAEQLTNNRQKLERASNNDVLTAQDIARDKQAAKDAIAETLRQIEQTQ